MKLLEYFTQKHFGKNYFYACYFDVDTKKNIPSFLVKTGKSLAYDVLNERDVRFVNLLYIKHLSEYHNVENKHLSLFKAKKLAKKYADIYTDFVVDEMNGHVDEFGLMTKVKDKIDPSNAIELSEDDYVVKN